MKQINFISDEDVKNITDIINNVCKYCEDMAIYDKIGVKYNNFYYKAKQLQKKFAANTHENRISKIISDLQDAWNYFPNTTEYIDGWEFINYFKFYFSTTSPSLLQMCNYLYTDEEIEEAFDIWKNK